MSKIPLEMAEHAFPEKTGNPGLKVTGVRVYRSEGETGRRWAQKKPSQKGKSA